MITNYQLMEDIYQGSTKNLPVSSTLMHEVRPIEKMQLLEDICESAIFSQEDFLLDCL